MDAEREKEGCRVMRRDVELRDETERSLEGSSAKVRAEVIKPEVLCYSTLDYSFFPFPLRVGCL